MEKESAEPRKAPRPALRWLLVLAWMGLIFYVSSRSQLPTGHGALGEAVSFGGHLSEYAILGGLLRWALSARAGLLTLAIAVLYALSDEFHQSFVPGRNASALDFLVDILAASLAIAALPRLLGAIRRSRRSLARRP
ncbi:MAG: VanZ family protein [Chloroflexi bacterium]|nr:VanZ family protein [Chloroflexota bacterium]